MLGYRFGQSIASFLSNYLHILAIMIAILFISVATSYSGENPNVVYMNKVVDAARNGALSALSKCAAARSEEGVANGSSRISYTPFYEEYNGGSYKYYWAKFDADRNIIGWEKHDKPPQNGVSSMKLFDGEILHECLVAAAAIDELNALIAIQKSLGFIPSGVLIESCGCISDNIPGGPHLGSVTCEIRFKDSKGRHIETEGGSMSLGSRVFFTPDEIDELKVSVGDEQKRTVIDETKKSMEAFYAAIDKNMNNQRCNSEFGGLSVDAKSNDVSKSKIEPARAISDAEVREVILSLPPDIQALVVGCTKEGDDTYILEVDSDGKGGADTRVTIPPQGAPVYEPMPVLLESPAAIAGKEYLFDPQRLAFQSKDGKEIVSIEDEFNDIDLSDAYRNGGAIIRKEVDGKEVQFFLDKEDIAQGLPQARGIFFIDNKDIFESTIVGAINSDSQKLRIEGAKNYEGTSISTDNTSNIETMRSMVNDALQGDLSRVKEEDAAIYVLDERSIILSISKAIGSAAAEGGVSDPAADEQADDAVWHSFDDSRSSASLSSQLEDIRIPARARAGAVALTGSILEIAAGAITFYNNSANTLILRTIEDGCPTYRVFRRYGPDLSGAWSPWIYQTKETATAIIRGFYRIR